MNTPQNRRILLIDDMPSIHNDFRKILLPASNGSALELAEAALFGPEDGHAAVRFELDSAYQGREGLDMVQAAISQGRPYALAFVDMRMPPGWDGVETIERLWEQDPRLQIVICTAYSDYSWTDALSRIGAHDRLLVLKKPFDGIEVSQLAGTLTTKWQATQQASAQMAWLEEEVGARTLEIRRANQALQQEIAERKHLESQLIQSEKLASIGQLAAGVAHEINNPIGYVFSNFRTLETYFTSFLEILGACETIEPGAQSAQAVAAFKQLYEQLEIDFLREDIPVLMRESKQGLDRVRQIVQDLKDFSRTESVEEWQFANLETGIDSTLNIVASEIKYKADVVKRYGGVPEIECVASQINQVVMNLLVNAAQALGAERGTITISTGTADGEVWVEVKDTGCGMPPEVVSHIFDPFFTTKPIGKGTGLGLSLSHGIVQKHGGRIQVQTEPGRGTSFRVVLPIHKPGPAAE